MTGLHRKGREFHGKFWAVIYLRLKFTFKAIVIVKDRISISIDHYAKDGGEELFTRMHCVL